MSFFLVLFKRSDVSKLNLPYWPDDGRSDFQVKLAKSRKQHDDEAGISLPMSGDKIKMMVEMSKSFGNRAAPAMKAIHLFSVENDDQESNLIKTV